MDKHTLEEIHRIAREAREAMHQMPPMFGALNGGTPPQTEEEREAEYMKKWAEDSKAKSGSANFHAWDGLD